MVNRFDELTTSLAGRGSAGGWLMSGVGVSVTRVSVSVISPLACSSGISADMNGARIMFSGARVNSILDHV